MGKGRCRGRGPARHIFRSFSTMAMSLEMTPQEEDERVLEARRHRPPADVAWVAIFLVGLVLGCGALFWTLWGRFFDPGFYEAVSGGTWTVTSALVSPGIERVATAGVRFAGFLGVMASVFVIAISLTSFRRRERWAWYVIWAVPAFAALDFAMVAGYQALTLTSILWDAALLVLALVGLGFSYRALFPPPGAAEIPSEARPSLA